jgi:hypothetical protein
VSDKIPHLTVDFRIGLEEFADVRMKIGSGPILKFAALAEGNEKARAYCITRLYY